MMRRIIGESLSGKRSGATVFHVEQQSLTHHTIWEEDKQKLAVHTASLETGLDESSESRLRSLALSTNISNMNGW